ncbi:MAG: sulfotransferase [bacterium]|nr:sulfotransferase [bacterium]
MNPFAKSEGELLEAAVAQAGCEDFGEDEFRAGLRVLLEALDDNTLLNGMGRLVIRHLIVRDLAARLIAQRGFREVPDSAAQPIERPLVIVGLPRTGTTALQEMLSLDPQFQGIELWLTRAPKPRPARAAWSADPDYRACDESVALIRAHQPELYAIHRMEAAKVDECWNLMAQSFAHSSWLAQTQLPAYRAWFDTCDMRPVYERHRRNLQLIGANEPAKRWLLKDSTHLFALEALLEVYPDACVVQTHRDPVSSIPSVCSLCWTARHTLNKGESRSAYGRGILDLWHGGVERTLAVRKRKDREQFFDVSFRRFKEDPVATIDGIYSHFGLHLDAATRARMEGYRSENPPPVHRYTPDEWGLGAGEIRERFADYAATHDLS